MQAFIIAMLQVILTAAFPVHAVAAAAESPL
jgi:hypothetical protein